jgi:hypothetical protein
MCPFCLTSAALLITGALSSAGMATLAARVSRRKSVVAPVLSTQAQNGFKFIDV